MNNLDAGTQGHMSQSSGAAGSHVFVDLTADIQPSRFSQPGRLSPPSDVRTRHPQSSNSSFADGVAG
eukprot:CAMPEP_0172877454 /NCGR_PEP_ID=MMETSP1075-20121228/106994_1 /TAXON_ID=2916 /ORGANISM="Ceratium fusus, Strain PA161109" /LENGTH=66 /DNA_ID=CAMNT_0013729021 /DNA_START=51 /DNA_END=248 /DNA_ORIENTATION=+